MDGSEVYAAARTRIGDLVRALDDEQLQRHVAATPRWRVRDVVAHLAGVIDDFANGRMDGAPGPTWTAVQVESRADLSVAEILERWSSADAALAGTVQPLAIDIVTHEHDVRGALGAQVDKDGDEVDWLLQRLVAALGPRLDKAELGALRLRAGTDEWIVGTGEPDTSVAAEPFELVRAVMGRRSEAQVRSFGWDGDPGPYLAVLPIFPFAASDLRET